MKAPKPSAELGKTIFIGSLMNVTSHPDCHSRAFGVAGLVMFEFPSNRNGAAYLNKRTSLETSNIARAAGVCCLADVCRVAEIGACEKEHPGRAKRQDT